MDKKILFVDDEPINLILIETYLEEHVSMDTCQSAAEALEILSENKEQYSMVVTDLKMPEMDGIAFARKLQEGFPEITRVLMTAYFINDEIQSYLDSGLIEKVYQKEGDMDKFVEDFVDYLHA